jgi:hypothetical protein
MSYQQTLNVLAGGSPEKRSLGAYAFVVIRDATVPVEISFDGQVWQPAGRNDSFGPLTPPASDIFFRAAGGIAGAVTFAWGLSPLPPIGNFTLPPIPTLTPSGKLWR